MELKTAIVTGASSGIGLAIAKMLSAEGYKVYGIGRIFPEDADFFEKRLSLDIRDTDILLKKVSEIKIVDLLVNAAGSAYYGLAEFNTADQIKEMCRTDLEAPMILTSALIPRLKETKGMVINIASVTSTRINTHGAAYGALKAGLRSYGRSLYEEVRKTGIRVVTVCPDLTIGTKLKVYESTSWLPSVGLLAEFKSPHVGSKELLPSFFVGISQSLNSPSSHLLKPSQRHLAVFSGSDVFGSTK